MTKTRMLHGRSAGVVLIFLLAMAQPSYSETGAKAWLGYARLTPQAAKQYERLPGAVVRLGNSAVQQTAQRELALGVVNISGRRLGADSTAVRGNAFVLGTAAQFGVLAPELHPPQNLL